jgi:hypothetical protein
MFSIGSRRAPGPKLLKSCAQEVASLPLAKFENSTLRSSGPPHHQAGETPALQWISALCSAGVSPAPRPRTIGKEGFCKRLICDLCPSPRTQNRHNAGGTPAPQLNPHLNGTRPFVARASCLRKVHEPQNLQECGFCSRLKMLRNPIYGGDRPSNQKVLPQPAAAARRGWATTYLMMAAGMLSTHPRIQYKVLSSP